MRGGYARYPGAQPFADEDVSRAVFFGREKECATLLDQILANRLLVVYAKSGLGKTSLLQAGIAQALRDDDCLPLFVRINDVKQGPVRSVFNDVRDRVRRRNVEYVPGNELSLWHFFKTAEFWDGDRMLTPVLVLDQFEELFTLHDAEVRANFLDELGHLVRGVRPTPRTSSDAEPELTDTTPEMRIVLSLREDYLGSLDEASYSIPQILDHRFRLTPLSIEGAVAALERPAQVEDERLTTRPFGYSQDTVRSILAYLSRRRTGSAVRNYVEPFQLQLICQRVEALVTLRQGGSEQRVEIGLDDLGGEPGLRETLRDFYKQVIKTIKPVRTRWRVRRLCEQYLISPEGRRLSLERGEIMRMLNLGPNTLNKLVNSRLLRSDPRADSWYYELSHDSLVSPVLATRKPQAIAIGALGLVASVLGCISGVLLLVVAVSPVHQDVRGTRFSRVATLIHCDRPYAADRRVIAVEQYCAASPELRNAESVHASP